MAVTNYTPKAFTIQRVFEIILRDPVTKKPLGILENCKTTGLESPIELVYASGGAGNVYIGEGHAHSRRATVSVSSGEFKTSLMGMQVGETIVTGESQIVPYYDVIEIGAGGSCLTKHTAQGTADAEIGYLYKLNDDGTFGDEFTQAGTASAGKFSYVAGTKTISFDAGETPSAGDFYACVYNIDTGSSAQMIPCSVDGQPGAALVTLVGLAKATDGKGLFKVAIDGFAQIDGTINMDLAADGDPAEQGFNLEFVRQGRAKNLYKTIVYNEADVA